MGQTVVVISDTHLTHLPDKRKLRFLLNSIGQADLVIINGDFWDSYLTTIQRFTSTPHWQPLFQALREKEAVYLYGNHDSATSCEELESTFSTTHGATHELTQSGSQFHIEHGNKITPETDETHPNTPRALLIAGTLADNLFTQMGK